MTNKITTTTNAEQEATFQKDVADSQALATTLNAITTEQLLLSEKIGAFKAFEFSRKIMTVSTIKILAEIKNSKEYKGLQVFDVNGNCQHVSTWEQFCTSLGVSRQKVDEDIQNLSKFGEDFLETSQRIGLGYRDLRKLRKIPEEDREVIINGEAVQAEDKDSLIELIEDMSIKHVKQKEKLSKQIKSLEQETKAKDAVIRQKQETIDAKNDEIIAMDAKLAHNLSAPAYERAQDFVAQIKVISVDALQLFGKINALYEQIEQDSDLPELLRVNQGHLLLEIKAEANKLIDHYYLGDVSVTDDDMTWVEEANAELAKRQAQNTGDIEGSNNE
ncbi:hypothetical protein [Psychrobacter sp. I-STPA10]|uniref:hypothetical protein n=1 Tax=Psychrobacter sp. I-STPA10 TaxID=2585769 RepID=UPI001E522100|nr:hypothetical protein [Psychrobacter sp. I-STPA10]